MNTRIALMAALLALPCAPTLAACPSQPTAERYTLNGAEVTDKKTGLIWARCAVGQTWDGSTCTGQHSVMNHVEAMQLAQSTSGWRLPNVKELAMITDRGCTGTTVDNVAFPGISSSSLLTLWTSTPYVGAPVYAYAVDFASGTMNGRYRYDLSGVGVQLVRISP